MQHYRNIYSLTHIQTQRKEATDLSLTYYWDKYKGFVVSQVYPVNPLPRLQWCVIKIKEYSSPRLACLTEVCVCVFKSLMFHIALIIINKHAQNVRSNPWQFTLDAEINAMKCHIASLSTVNQHDYDKHRNLNVRVRRC